MTIKFTSIDDQPDLIFGLVGPIGVDLDYVGQTLSDALKGFDYQCETIHLTKVMTELKAGIEIKENDLVEAYNSKIAYANYLRKKFDSKDILAALSVAAIKKSREAIIEKCKSDEIEIPRFARIIRQLKTPEEIDLLRSVYGRQFIQVSIYGAPHKRAEYLIARMKIKSKGTKDDKLARIEANDLIDRDQKEEDEFGQNVSNCFALGDIFLDSNDRTALVASINRFINALFGSNEVSPTRDEYGMYLAKSASLRSCDLSRQVGSAICCDSGEIVSLGSNEVPKAGGGTYWGEDDVDGRDIMQGHDPNELNKIEMFADLINRLYEDKLLSDDLVNMESAQNIVSYLLSGEKRKRYKKSRIMDIIEFGRIIHAEMSAISDAARNGISIKNTNMFVTTFPCHLCAKHIVSSGIKRVIYLEPYPKSYARQLHSDSIQIEEKNDSKKVVFQPFIGISPYRYRDLFEKNKRKNDDGEAVKWKSDPRRPNIDVVYASYKYTEDFVLAKLAELVTSRDIEVSIPSNNK